MRVTSRRPGSWTRGCALVLWGLSGAALAEEGAYAGFAGAGGALRFLDEPSAPVRGAVVLKSVYGLRDRLNWEGPAWLELGGGTPTLGLGSGLEYVYFNSNHWRLNVGLGVAARAPLRAPLAVELGPYVETAVRWLFAWGVGLGLEVHALYGFSLQGGGRGLSVVPALALYTEY